jgi:hypothetical protein
LDVAGWLTAAGYIVLGSILCWSRFVGLGRGYSADELGTVRDYISKGPHAILVGPYLPNNHELYSLLAWSTSSIVGESATAFRLWSAVPFVAGVVVVTVWLHRRMGALSGLLFLFFATASPLLLDITRQARGYGLAFLAMSLLVVAALEATDSGRTWTIVAFCVAGLVGTLTLPDLGIAFAATGVVLLRRRELRRRTAFGLMVCLLAIVAWYAPHLHDLSTSSRQQYGAPIPSAWVITAPFDQILSPGLRWNDETLFVPSLGDLALAALLALLVGSSPLLRRRSSSLVLCSGVVATVVVVWATRIHVAPRFFSFLLVPLLILLSTGISTIVTRSAGTRRLSIRLVIAAVTLGLVALISVSDLQQVARYPREATKEVAAAIRSVAPSTPVYAYMPYPRELDFYLGRHVARVQTPRQALQVCRSSGDVVFVYEPWLLQPVSVPCTQRQGARLVRFRQYAQGGEMNVWFIPAAR